MTTLYTKRHALRFVILLGIVSLFADVTYEGARSITGPFLGTLGASAAIVGVVAGFGEFLGYGLRLFSGYFSDRSGRYWPIAIFGYLINLSAVPLLALANHWWIAGLLIIAERAGKGIRAPARDAMLSHAAERIGMGWGFGLHEALDQLGAMCGPLLVTLVLFYHGSYQRAFAFLLFPALAALVMLLVARLSYPNPKLLEESPPILYVSSLKKNKPFWIYLIGASFVAMGYADFALIAYHFGHVHLLPDLWIPLFYAVALGANMLMAPLLGTLYDRYGFGVLLVMTFIAGLFPPFVFLGNQYSAIFGVILWGMGFGAQGSLMRAIVGNMVSKDKRGTAYGIFNSVFGLFWFVGSSTMGFLYDQSILTLVIFSLSAELIALPFLGWAMYLLRKK